MSDDITEGLFRWYVLKHAKGHVMLKVPFKQVAGMIEIVGDMIVGCGDSRDEALTDWANSQLPAKKKRVYWFKR